MRSLYIAILLIAIVLVVGIMDKKSAVVTEQIVLENTKQVQLAPPCTWISRSSVARGKPMCADAADLTRRSQ